MAYGFVVKGSARVIPAVKIVRRSTDFAAIVRIAGTSYQFLFSWNGLHGYYSMKIVRDDNRVLLQRWPETGEFTDPIRNFSLKNPEMPDARIAILDTTGENAALSPANFGDTHFVAIMLGRVVPL
jgi:hypothetical protein